MARYSVIAVLKTTEVPGVLRDVIPYIPQEEMLRHFTVKTLSDQSPGKIICEQLCTIIQGLLEKYPNNIIEIMSVSHTLIPKQPRKSPGRFVAFA